MYGQTLHSVLMPDSTREAIVVLLDRMACKPLPATRGTMRRLVRYFVHILLRSVFVLTGDELLVVTYSSFLTAPRAILKYLLNAAATAHEDISASIFKAIANF